MELTLPDLIDKMSILKLKIERIGEPHLKIEYAYYEKEICKLPVLIKPLMDVFLKKLYQINGKIWDLEHEIREGSKCKLSLKEVGRRTLIIRDLNKKRVAIKDKIVDETGSGFKDIKMNS